MREWNHAEIYRRALVLFAERLMETLASWRAVRPRHGEFRGDARVEPCRDLSAGAGAVCGEAHGGTASAVAVSRSGGNQGLSRQLEPPMIALPFCGPGPA